jgi:hypothetical protein
MSHPTSVGTADFKGQFKTLDGEGCNPLTLVDGFSRYCLACVGLWHIRPCACNIEGMAVGRALAGTGLQPGPIAVTPHANATG